MPAVTVTEWDPEWSDAFEDAARKLAQALGPEAFYIHHIGSTAVPGLAAKPIIDMLPVLTDIAVADRAVPALQALGYEAMGEWGLPGRRLFRKRGTRRHGHHVHCYAAEHPDVARHLAFRDYLRASWGERNRYGHLKRELAGRFPDDIDSYMDGKDAYIKAVEGRALRWWAPTPLVLISGPVGVGKTTVLGAVGELLGAAGVAHTLADRDQFTEIFPRFPGDRFGERFGLVNLAAIWKNARAAGARCLVMAGVIESQEDLDAHRRLVNDSVVTLIELTAPPGVIQRRLAERETGANLAWHLERAVELTEILAAQRLSAIRVDATAEPTRVARAVLEAAGLPGRLVNVDCRGC